jgi:transcriptional regulator with XRE-family HTH domain/tetratricopeptide (TPR) repeat protein
VPVRDEMRMLARVLRAIRGASQEEMGAASSIDRTTISRYETGEMIPSRPHLARLAGAAGLSLAFAESVLLPVVRLVLQPAAAKRQRVPAPAEVSAAATAAMEQRLVATVRAGFASLVTGLSLGRAAHPTSPPAVEDRDSVAEQWEQIRSCPSAERPNLIERRAGFHSWVLCEKLCEESARAAAQDDAPQALNLAQLGLLAAQHAPGSAAWNACMQGFAWAFVGNALRAAGDLPAADAAFAMVRTLWRAARDPVAGVLAAWRVPYMEASLRRDQHSLRHALDLLARALALAPGEATGRVLVRKATVLQRAGEIAAALATLDEAERRIDAGAQPRLGVVLRYHQAACLCHLGRFRDAERQLCRVNEACLAADHDPGLLRFAWLKARIAAGLGQRHQAREGFEMLRAAYAARERMYEVALVSLELAIVYLEEGRVHEVRAMAESMFCIFGSQRIHREALAALRSFCEAPEVAGAASGQVEELRACLDRVRQDPQVIFGSTRPPGAAAGGYPGRGAPA